MQLWLWFESDGLTLTALVRRRHQFRAETGPISQVDRSPR
jgi:hypothetical protein